MVDVVDVMTRSRMMAGIRGKNTKPELVVRRYLHACGYRFRLHRKDLPGQPDLVLPKYKLAIFVHGCFWHRHENCVYATSPQSRCLFWEEKLTSNVKRDKIQLERLAVLGWRVLVIWECGLKHSLDDINGLQEMILCATQNDLTWPRKPPRPKVSV
jgi:DNA mismatch endonuclease (patch repair protein)